MKIEEFIESCRQKGVECSSVQTEQFLRYAQLLKEWNEKMNLTAITELEEVLEKHFYDSLAPFFSLEMKGHLCDVGAGAGFPSLPLKIMFPQLKVTILEPLNKRVVFLNEVCRQLQLDGVDCLNVRAEDYAAAHRESFDLVTARAVANLQVLSELCLPLVKKDGLFVAMKGSAGKEEQEQADRAVKILGGRLEKTEEVRLQDGASRINLFYRKVKPTPSQYPRAYAKIKKNPL